MSSPADRGVALALVILVAFAAGCATSSGMRRGREAELAQDYDRAVVEYLERVLALDATDFGREMFESTSDVSPATRT